jgi:serine/threonine protein kinase
VTVRLPWPGLPCPGLRAVHGKSIVHGDLKPDNVLLKMDAACTAGLVAKLTDFGLSAALGPDRTHVSNFVAGTVGGHGPEAGLMCACMTSSNSPMKLPVD